jgi:hypothetical protein
MRTMTSLRHPGKIAPYFVLVGVSFLHSIACSGSIVSNPVSTPEADASLDAQIVVESPPDASDGGRPDARVSPEGPIPFEGGPVAPLQVIDLGTVGANTVITFTVPAGTLGFHVMVESTTESDLAVVSVEAPSGARLLDNSTPKGGDHPTSQTLFGKTASAQIPQGAHADGPIETGIWKAVFAGEGALRAKVQIQKTADGLFRGARLNLNVYLPKGIRLGAATPITAQTAWSRPEIRERIEGLFDNLESFYNIRNGSVRFFDTPARYLVLEDARLFTVFSESRVAPADQAINIMLSELPADPVWWGISAGIPGAANTPGNDQSGVALANVPEAPPEFESAVLAHELGHFMGLNHTTEISGNIADPLPDTPRCVGISEGTLNSCPDITNIMFPSGAAGNRSTASKMQRRVLYGSPMLEAFLQGTVLAPAVGLRRTPRDLDYGRLFGHPGSPLSAVEQSVLAATCPHPSHLRARLAGSDRTELLQIAQAPGAAILMRNVATRMLMP